MTTRLWAAATAFAAALAGDWGGLAAAQTASGAERWTGFYVGAQIGAADAEADGRYDTDEQLVVNDFRDTIDGRLFQLAGGAGGFYAGYAWSLAGFALGVELDAIAMTGRDTLADADPEFDPSTDAASLGLDWIASARLRAGLPSGRTLLFVAPGAAWYSGRYSARNGDDDRVASGAIEIDGLGFVIGAGVEHDLGHGFALRLEGRHYVFNDKTETGALTVDSDPGDFVKLETVSLASLGLSYRFGPGAPVSAEVAPATWTGLHLGVHGGFVDAAADGIFDTDELSSEQDVDDSVFAGLFALRGGGLSLSGGYDHQIGRFVLGVAADATLTDVSDRRTDPDPELFGTDEASLEIHALASIRARAGVASGRSLFYATGGLGWVSATYVADDAELAPFGVRDRGARDIEAFGPVIGGGFEHQFRGGLAMTLDALVYGFDKPRDTSALSLFDSDAGDFIDLEHVTTVRAGLRYRFGQGG